MIEYSVPQGPVAGPHGRYALPAWWYDSAVNLTLFLMARITRSKTTCKEKYGWYFTYVHYRVPQGSIVGPQVAWQV